MQDRPEAREMVEAVAGFLQGEVVPALADPRLRFRARVAANMLAVVARELGAGEAPLRQEWRRLVALLDESAAAPPCEGDELRDSVRALTRSLCARIRAAEADEGPWHDAVLAHAEQTVIEKLRIANPRYLERMLGADREC